MIYIAFPFRDPDPQVQTARLLAATRYERSLIAKDIPAWNPVRISLPFKADRDDWIPFDTKVISYCSAIHVLMLPGWDQSHGVGKEIDAAKMMNITIEMIDTIEPFTTPNIRETLDGYAVRS